MLRGVSVVCVKGRDTVSVKIKKKGGSTINVRYGL